MHCLLRPLWANLIGVALLVVGCGTSAQEQVAALNREGVANLLQNNYSAAEAQFQRALTLAPNDPHTHYNLAALAHAQGKLSEAEEHYRQALSLDPHLLPARRGLAQLLWQENRQDELRQLVSEWLRSRPDSADTLALYGWYLLRQGDYPAAESALDRALALDPRHAFALAERGRLYEIYSYPDRARSLYERSLERDPWQPQLQARLTQLRRKLP
jgi:Tfp pilus assembly protein PilF